MSQSPRFLAPVWLVFVAITAAPASLADDPDAYLRLQAIPRERRVALSENLDRFDKLDKSEQAAIRKLDAEIGRKDPVEQTRYRSVLRRYHLWVNSLTDDQKRELREAGSAEARFNKAREYRLKEREKAASGSRLFGIRTGEFGLVGPYEAAQLLKIWNKLTTAKKEEIEKHHERGRLFKEIRDQNKSLGVHYVPFPIAEEKLYDARLDGDKSFKDQLGSFAQRVPFEALSKKADPAAHPKTDVISKKFALRFTEFLYFEDHKPKPVLQINLERFSASCPNWLHAMLDSLSADDARNYLTILYRLLYPEPTEMPADPKPAKSSSDTPSKPARTAPKKSGHAGPF